LLSERRRTARELDQLLGCDRYPDVRLAYGLRGGDEEAAALRQPGRWDADEKPSRS